MPFLLLGANSQVLTCSVRSLFNTSKYTTFKLITRVVTLYIDLPTLLSFLLNITVKSILIVIKNCSDKSIVKAIDISCKCLQICLTLLAKHFTNETRHTHN